MNSLHKNNVKSLYLRRLRLEQHTKTEKYHMIKGNLIYKTINYYIYSDGLSFYSCMQTSNKNNSYYIFRAWND